MDIDLLSKMVKELILDNDKVVLPGLGSFVAETVPSTFSDKGYTINPPYRRLYFRSKPDTDDGLVNFYAESNGLEQDVACRILGDFIAELRTIIFTKKLVVLPGLGRLRATKENNIFFIADEDLDIYPAGFGLEPISLKTHQETKEEVTAAVAGLRSLLDDVPNTQTQPEIIPESVPEPEAPLEQETIPASDSEQESLPEPEAEPVSEPISEPVSEPEHAEAQTQTQRRGIFMKVFIVAASVLLVLTVTYAIVGRMFPEWIDQYLYTAEELRILHHRL